MVEGAVAERTELLGSGDDRRPLVSVITPTFNHERYIGECVESVLAQTYARWEMIVVDDGSTDGTLAALEAFRDPRIRVIRRAHAGLAGLADTYNAGLAESSGPLIAILEGDDTWPPEKLERQTELMLDERVVLSFGWARIVDEGGDPLGIAPAHKPPEDALLNEPVGRSSFRALDSRLLTFAWPATILMRRGALKACGGFQSFAGLGVVDLPLLLHMGLQGRWAYLDACLGIWRRHSASTTLSRWPRILNGAYELAAAFAREHGEDIPASESEWIEVDKAWQDFQYERLSLLGRVWAGQKRFREARAAFQKAASFRLGPKAKSLLFLAATLVGVHASPEPAFLLAGRKGVAQLWPPSDGDPSIDPAMSLHEFADHDLRLGKGR